MTNRADKVKCWACGEPMKLKKVVTVKEYVYSCGKDGEFRLTEEQRKAWRDSY